MLLFSNLTFLLTVTLLSVFSPPMYILLFYLLCRSNLPRGLSHPSSCFASCFSVLPPLQPSFLTFLSTLIFIFCLIFSRPLLLPTTLSLFSSLLYLPSSILPFDLTLTFPLLHQARLLLLPSPLLLFLPFSHCHFCPIHFSPFFPLVLSWLPRLSAVLYPSLPLCLLRLSLISRRVLFLSPLLLYCQFLALSSFKLPPLSL